jgi:hypothetical protein
MLPMKAGLPSQALRLVPYLTPEEIKQLCAGCPGAPPGTGRPPHPPALPDRAEDLRGLEHDCGASQPAASQAPWRSWARAAR